MTMSMLPVRSPLPNSVPSMRSAPASRPSSAGGDGAAAIVVRVQAHADVLALCDVAAEVLDLIREHVRRRHLDRAPAD